MFLKSLTLKGFKSFAETTTLEFEPGTTVVVGPNGSGKSNVVDAIGWVLGSQAPSAVRSQKMDDVIFAGTANRPPLGRAEVTLTVDNSAGLLPIDFSEVSITRTLFRGGESEYAINEVPCRLLDVQELLSDTGVGRQQHLIVSQGQIDGVLSARPEDRRLVIEEAAGVLKYRRRMEKAQRRLAATEGNLTRLHDLVREVRRQLRPLERQADAARRHGAIVAEVRALRTHAIGRDLAMLRSRLAERARRKDDLGAAEREHKRELVEIDAAVLAAEAEASGLGGDRLGEAMGRAESLRERAKGVIAVVAERRRGIEQERRSFLDGAVVATLEADAARVRSELEDSEAEAAELARQAAMLDPAPATGRLDDVRRELISTQAAVDHGEAQLARETERLATLEERRAAASADSERSREMVVAAAEDLAAREKDHEIAVVGRAQADAAFSAAEGELRRAESERDRWTARADTLEQALDAARARAGIARLAGLDGIVGTLLDLVEVDPGFELAFEAAAGEALAAVVVDSVESGRGALAALRSGNVAGAVLPASLAANPPPIVSIASAEALRGHVRSDDPRVGRLLDALLAPAIVVAEGWARAVEVAASNPTAIVVTPDGDRLGATGWRVGGTIAGATGAALAEARTRVASATAAAREAEIRVAEARAGRGERHVAAEDAAARLETAGSEHRAAAAAAERAASLEHDIAAELDRHRSVVSTLEADLEHARTRAAELEAALGPLETEARDLAARRGDIDARTAAVEARRTHGRRRLAELDDRLSRLDFGRAEALERLRTLDLRAVALDRLAGSLDPLLARVEAELERLGERRRLQSEAAHAVVERLERLRGRRIELENQLEETRERLRRAELDEAETRLRLEQVVETCRHELDLEPSAAEAAECPPLPEGVTPAARLRELERELRLMGPINPLAVEEYRELNERHEFLMDQMDDVKSTRRELTRVIHSVEEEIRGVFAAAYADVAENFARLFETLFPGGRGRLTLTDPENLLETGVEVEARPSGKNVKKLSLLSGGERSLTALAFLFAVFRSRPSPFYVLDEVEAALDDVNLHRFLDLVAEFRREAQLVIVSHQKRTMEAADCLYGITMQPAGSSKVISERVAAHA
jgi:chromosome segregation protein